jgi:predicted aspartyl protease
MKNVRYKKTIIVAATLYLLVGAGFIVKWRLSKWPHHSVTHSYGDSPVQRTPFVLENNLMVVAVRVNDTSGEQLRMVVDTGNPYSMITPGSADKLNLNIIRRWTLIGGSFCPSWRTQINKAEIGGITIADAMFTRRDIKTRPRKDGEPIQGLLGYKGFFEDAVWQVDYPARELRRYRTLPGYLSAPADRTDRVAFKMEPLNDERMVPVINEVYVDAHHVRALLDTGSSFHLSLKPQVINRYQLNVEWDDSRPCPSGNMHGVEAKRRRGRLKSLKMGSLELGPTEVCLEAGDDEWDVKIGGAVLQPYVVTFDYLNQQVFIELPTPESNSNKDAAQ